MTKQTLPLNLTCPTANALRLAWYQAATQVSIAPKSDPFVAEIIAQDRDKPAYYGARTRLQIHIQNCQYCKGETQ